MWASAYPLPPLGTLALGLGAGIVLAGTLAFAVAASPILLVLALHDLFRRRPNHRGADRPYSQERPA